MEDFSLRSDQSDSGDESTHESSLSDGKGADLAGAV